MTNNRSNSKIETVVSSRSKLKQEIRVAQRGRIPHAKHGRTGGVQDESSGVNGTSKIDKAGTSC